MNNTIKPFYLLIFLLALVVNFIGINTDFFTDDPGLYASIAKIMVRNNDLLQLFTYNQDWLDKPHFPFWAVFVSFKLFGISVWAYRLPALIFFMLSAFYTYLFARKFYTAEIAITAVLILMTAQHVLLSNVDVRAEPYLMAFVTGSIYHIARLNERYSLTNFLLAALLTACAIITKGIFVIGAIYGALLGQLIFQGRFHSIFRPKWILLFSVTLLFTLPEFYALYIQFDLHPEKTVFSRHNVSGIKWFLWDSQFGRFVNNGPIKQKSSGSLLFFAHTLLWAFLPWCLLFYYALYNNIKSIIQKVKLQEYYTLSGGLFLLLLFSLSGFQLPFYTNTIFPLFAIITAPVLYRQLSHSGEIFRNISQWLFIAVLPALIILIHIFLKPANSLFFAIDCVAFAIIIVLVILRVKAIPYRMFLLSCSTMLFANFYMNGIFFNTLASYNGQISAARYVNQSQFKGYKIYSLRPSNNVFQFYCDRPVDYVTIADFNSMMSSQQSLFYVNQQSLSELTQNHSNIKVIKSFINYPQENILPKFVNKATRNTVLDQVYLISK
jgi:4-amino-4-deoxy-L-arabinose transferase-like glycosyltransferase